MENLAVWGNPIGHSRSPDLHSAAYRRLGLDWQYSRREVSAADFVQNLAGLDQSWRGLSLTMPLKEVAWQQCQVRDRYAQLTGAVNTILIPEPGQPLRGWNTDVPGLAAALHEAGVNRVDRVRILGGGATAASALIAAVELGAGKVEIVARSASRAEPLLALGQELGVLISFNSFAGSFEPADLTIATLPSGTVLDTVTVADLAASGGVLFDVAYSPWPSALAAGWTGQVASGLGMLLHQAVRQVRIFVSANPEQPLPDEERVVAEMRRALMGD